MLRILRICPIHKVSDFKYSPVLNKNAQYQLKCVSLEVKGTLSVKTNVMLRQNMKLTPAQKPSKQILSFDF